MASSDVASLTHKLLPILDWIPGYRRDWLLPDVLAGLAPWAVMVPEGMAYAGIVGVPPIMGLYTIVPALLAYALLGTSRQLVVGPDTATGLISAVTVGAIASQGTAEFNSLTSTLAVLIGLFFFSFGVMRMGWVASFIPTPVMRGFIEGLVYVTIIGQVPHLLGISGASGNFFTKLWHVLPHLPDGSLAPAPTREHASPWPRPQSLSACSVERRLVCTWSATSHPDCLSSRYRTSTAQYCRS